MTTATQAAISPTVIPASDHQIDSSRISRKALQVVERLREGGFQAYIVGGAVRDLLLGARPKDFDVATDATPEEVDALFKNGRLIGRRFKLVHVRFGREIIEVATFRGSASPANTGAEVDDEDDDLESADAETSEAEVVDGENTSTDAVTNDRGRILRDNVYGTMEEDALRRDFTINALYYCPKDDVVYDYANGIQDMDEGYVRFIGDPVTRYREDPVRMLRAIRFAVKLDFDIHPDTEQPIHDLNQTLADIPAARMFEEVLKLFHSGKGLQCYDELRYFGLYDYLFPQVKNRLSAKVDEFPESLIRLALSNTDQRLSQRKKVTPAFVFAIMLWDLVCENMRQKASEGTPQYQAMRMAGREVLDQQAAYISIPKRFRATIQEVWELQLRLEQRQRRQLDSVFQHSRFRAAYDFLYLRAEVGDVPREAAEWWNLWQEANLAQRELMRADLPQAENPNRRRRRRRKPSGEGDNAGKDAQSNDQLSDSDVVVEVSGNTAPPPPPAPKPDVDGNR
jgi:poly(A) polymerase